LEIDLYTEYFFFMKVQGLILGPIPFNVFLSDLDDGIKCTLMKIATRLIGKVDVSEGRATLQQDLDRLEDRVHKNLMKFNKDKCILAYLLPPIRDRDVLCVDLWGAIHTKASAKTQVYDYAKTEVTFIPGIITGQFNLLERRSAGME
ncbi:hypothetical protein HGM15179_002092, partial [Zosterops borbonicus]